MNYNRRVDRSILEAMRRRLNDCIVQLGPYCVGMAQSIKKMVIRRNSPLRHSKIAAMALEGKSAPRAHLGRNISDLDIRLTDHQETQDTKNENTDEILAILYIEFVAIRKEREIEKQKCQQLGDAVRNYRLSYKKPRRSSE